MKIDAKREDCCGRHPHTGHGILFSVLTAMLICAAAGLSGGAWAQAASTWPSKKPIQLVVPFAPGGGTDIVGRLLASAMEPLLGQKIIVENRGGAQGAVGARYVSAAAPDGYTLLHGTIGINAVNEYLYSNLPYDPKTAFVPVARFTTTANVLLVSAASPYHTLADVIAAAKEKAGKMNYGIPAVGDAAHLGFELLRKLAHIQGQGVIYNGVPPALSDVIGGRLDMVTAAVQAAFPMIASGKLRPIAVLTEHRLPTLPDVPTVAESGFPGFQASGWQGLFVPAGTPSVIVAKLSAAVKKALQDPKIVSAAQGMKIDLTYQPPQAFAAFVVSERAKWSSVIREAGIKAE